MQSPPPSNNSDRKILPELTSSEKDELRESLLKPACGTNSNWAWSQSDKEKWEVTTGVWQQFYERWRDGPKDFKFDDKPDDRFPYVLDLGVDPEGNSLLPFHDGDTSGNRILVTKSYENMFYRLLSLRQEDKGNARGAVITGQPGVGKTTFLKLMLARLISADQVVLLCDSINTYLFYQGRVYTRLTQFGIGSLPKHQEIPYCPVWALIDVDFNDRGPPLSSTSNVWPIQASSPNPIRWKSWQKQYGAAELGMPLWNEEELMAGLCLQPEYNDFRSRLESLPLLGGSMLPTAKEVTIGAVLEVLQKGMERKKAEEEQEARDAEENEDRDEMGDGIGASATDQDEDMVGGEEAPMKVDEALEILVENATEEFGFIPRDVYSGVFQLSDTRVNHTTAFGGFNLDKLQKIVETFTTERRFAPEYAHRVLVIFPSPPESLRLDRWEIDLKSIRIREKFMFDVLLGRQLRR